MNLTDIGERIKTARRSAKLTQEELAELVEVSPHYIYEIERGTKTMSLHTLERIALVLHQSVDFLFWGNSAPFPEERQKLRQDRLNEITDPLPASRRDAIADILNTIIPYLKS